MSNNAPQLGGNPAALKEVPCQRPLTEGSITKTLRSARLFIAALAFTASLSGCDPTKDGVDAGNNTPGSSETINTTLLEITHASADTRGLEISGQVIADTNIHIEILRGSKIVHNFTPEAVTAGDFEIDIDFEGAYTDEDEDTDEEQEYTPHVMIGDTLTITDSNGRGFSITVEDSDIPPMPKRPTED